MENGRALFLTLGVLLFAAVSFLLIREYILRKKNWNSSPKTGEESPSSPRHMQFFPRRENLQKFVHFIKV